MSVSGFVHHVRPRYAEVDLQGVVFNAHWLTYFDDASTRFFECARATTRRWRSSSEFDVMVVKAVVEWQGPAGFDDDVAIAVAPGRIGTKSFDLVYTATNRGRARVHRDDHLRVGDSGDARVDGRSPTACARR